MVPLEKVTLDRTTRCVPTVNFRYINSSKWELVLTTSQLIQALRFFHRATKQLHRSQQRLFRPYFERVDTTSSLICEIQCSFSTRSHINPDIISVVVCTAANERNSCSSAKSIFVFFALALSSIQLIISAVFSVASPLAFFCSRF